MDDTFGITIEPADAAFARRAAERLDALAKPLGALGLFEEDIRRICALRRTLDVRVERPCVVVMAADNGVVAQGVSASGPEATYLVMQNVCHNTSSISLMCAAEGIACVPVDLGMLHPLEDPAVMSRRIRAGTADFSQGPAMERAEAVRAVSAGIEVARTLIAQGHDLIGVGEVGIANTTSAAAVTSCILGLDPEVSCGRGSGLDDLGLSRKVEVVRRALAHNSFDPTSAIDVLSKVSGLEICGMCGVFLGCAEARVPAVVDGYVSAAAAAAAALVDASCKDAMLASHLSAEPAHRMLLDHLGITPAICAEMRLGEGTGAAMFIPLLRQALAVFTGGATLADSHIDTYDPRGFQ